MLSAAGVSPDAPPAPARFGLVAVAASTGGLAVLRALAAGLPEDFPAPVVVVQHRAPQVPAYLDQLLRSSTRMRVAPARDGEALRPGWMYVAPADRHVRVAAGVLHLDDGPREHFTRPAADPLFVSVAVAYGSRAVGMVLTGRGHDGAAGAAAIRRAGGVVIVQDPATCAAPSMPQSVLNGGGADFVLPLAKLSDALVALVMAPSISTALFGLPLACGL